MTTLAEWLAANGAHHDVVTWARPYGDDWAKAWAECPRGDWLLGLAARRGVERARLVRAACACARLALDHVADDEARPLAAIEAAERWADGEDDPESRRVAARDADAAIDGAPDPAVAAAATAALAALGSIERPGEAASAAAAVAQASVLDAGECAMMSALAYAQSTCADRVRERIELDAIVP
ncbi:MAG TPA: hypothetical protein RMH99_32280 [Sandaracinaceae bacterium LLY-WYZ-13_1]|nr:hypothetical protein [Sandaracinaceae bacterium LLY-WYZ-13_1]